MELNALEEAVVSYWFRPKRYGYGATPTAWQGWLLTFAFVATLAGTLETLYSGIGGSLAHKIAMASSVILLVLYVLLARKKTDGPWRWRWGPDGEER
jgi:hypothetical protein